MNVRCLRFVLAVIPLAACAPERMPGPSDGAMLFAENCAVCHGAEARGDGPAAAGLPRRPADLTQIASRAGGEFPVARTLSIIDGYTKGTNEGRIMPEFGSDFGTSTVPVLVDGVMTPTPRPLAALLAYLESIQES